MLKIRMQRIGRRHDPHFRIVVIDARQGPKSGKFVEMLGSYDAKLGNVQIKADRAQYWLSQGAQATGTVHNFLVDQGIIKGNKVNVLPQKTPIVKEVPAEATSAPAAPAEEKAPDEGAESVEAPEDETDKAADDAPAPEAAETATEEPETEDVPAAAIADETPADDTGAEKESTA